MQTELRDMLKTTREEAEATISAIDTLLDIGSMTTITPPDNAVKPAPQTKRKKRSMNTRASVIHALQGLGEEWTSKQFSARDLTEALAARKFQWTPEAFAAATKGSLADLFYVTNPGEKPLLYRLTDRIND